MPQSGRYILRSNSIPTSHSDSHSPSYGREMTFLLHQPQEEVALLVNVDNSSMKSQFRWADYVLTIFLLQHSLIHQAVARYYCVAMHICCGFILNLLPTFIT